MIISKNDFVKFGNNGKVIAPFVKTIRKAVKIGYPASFVLGDKLLLFVGFDNLVFDGVNCAIYAYRLEKNCCMRFSLEYFKKAVNP